MPLVKRKIASMSASQRLEKSAREICNEEVALKLIEHGFRSIFKGKEAMKLADSVTGKHLLVEVTFSVLEPT